MLMGSLEGRVALVTGAAQGIGYGIAERLAADGAAVVVADRAAGPAGAAADKITGAGGTALAVAGDVRSSVDLDQWVAVAEQRFGFVDILVNNAAVACNKPFVDQTEQDWDLVVDTDLKGPFLCCKAVVPQMIRQGRGVILNISSMAALQYGGVPHVPYAAAKAGIIVMTRDLAQELGPHGIRVVAIAPGPILTPMSAHSLSDETRRAVTERVALRRWGDPSDIAAAAAFLVSDEGRFVTGITVPVAGG
jgi:3-oxoacyl-[acyl-carrier protein] reductase